MTDAAFVSFVKGHLRRASRFWRPLSETLKKANVRRGVYLCNGCKEEVPSSIVVNGKRVKNAVVDHILPVVDPSTGFTGWDNFVNNLFCESDNLQVLCHNCHTNIKSKKEVEERKSQAELRKLFPRNYQSWSNMNDRCNNPNSTGYEYYGERGVTVCERWDRRTGGAEAFQNFLNDMGERPEGKTLDRLDVNGNYTLGNCRWATWGEQGNNKRDNHYISYEGDIKTLEEWATTLNIKPNTILYRIRRGWKLDEALGKAPREKPHTSRLSRDTWNEVQKLRDDGYTIVELGEMFQIDHSQVSRKTISKSSEERNLAKIARDKRVLNEVE